MRLDVIAGRFALCDPIAGGTVRGLAVAAPVVSGQREKISNPAVLGRVVRLEELLTPALATADPAQVTALLDEVAGSRPTLSTVQVRPSATTPEQRAAQALAEVADAAALRSGAALLGPGPLADILTAAADYGATRTSPDERVGAESAVGATRAPVGPPR